jgi:serine protease Do
VLVKALIAAAWLSWATAAAAMQPPAAHVPAARSVAADEASQAPPEQDTAGEAVLEPDLADLPVSDSARVRLERARGSVIQIRSFFGNAATSATHGSGFATGDDGLIVTNYHVVSAAVLYPGQYRLEFLTDDNRLGRLQVMAIDVRNDLALVKATEDDLDLPPLRLREEIPRQGERAYSIGFPLDLGLTITEGVANGLVANDLESRIHYTGAINSGMSGGPALDARGAVYGVNVSLITNRQLVGFVVPARHVPPLLAAARRPLDDALSPRQVRAQVAAQVLAHQAEALAPPVDGIGTQAVHGYTLPTQMAATLECGTTGTTVAENRLHVEFVGCGAPSRLRIQPGLEVGQVQLQHRVVSSTRLHPLQFAERLNAIAASRKPAGSARDVADFACRDSLVSLDGFDARLSTCVRQYRLFDGLYDFELALVSVDHGEYALVSHVTLRGTGFDSGQAFIRRFLETMRWSP